MDENHPRHNQSLTEGTSTTTSCLRGEPASRRPSLRRPSPRPAQSEYPAARTPVPEATNKEQHDTLVNSSITCITSPPRHPDHLLAPHPPGRGSPPALGGTYQQHADRTCSATTMRAPRDEWIAVDLFEGLHQLALEVYDETIGLGLENLVVDGCLVKAPGGSQNTGRSPIERGKSELARSVLVDGEGSPLGRGLAGANRNDSPLLRPLLEPLRLFGIRLPPSITVHLDDDYGSQPTGRC